MKLEKPILVKLFERELVLQLTLVCCSTTRKDILQSHSTFNPQGNELTVTTLGTDGPPGTLLAPICVDGFNYDPANQSHSAQPVAYPTFYSTDFWLPDALKQFYKECFEFLKAQK